MSDVLLAAPNLQYLSIGGDLLLSLMQHLSIELPSVTTIRLRRMNMLFIQQICRWRLPALAHVIIDTISNVNALETFWEVFGPQIRTMELGQSLKYYISDSLSFFLPGCPNLEQLNYYLHFTVKPYPLTCQYPSLSIIGVHAHPTSFFPVGSSSYWEQLNEHFRMYSSPCFPALKAIELYGDWGPVLNDDSRSSWLIGSLQDRGYRVEWIRD